MKTKNARIEQNGYFYTAVAASEQEERAMRDSYKTPLIVVGGYVSISPEEVIHGVALSRGLPEIVGHYGYDFREHEFIRLADADKGEPDKWPSRKLSDVLAAAGLRTGAS